MSHRVVNDFAAIRFPAEQLRAVLGDRFHDDKFMFFELGGDNNLWTTSPKGGREVRVRSWSLLEIGSKWEVMRQIVTFAASCEGGGMRFNGERGTLAENYIRKARNVLESAVPARALVQAGLSCSLKIGVNLIGEGAVRGRFDEDALNKLRAIMSPVDGDNTQTWHLHPLHDIKHAAIMFEYAGLDKTPIYNMASVNGREYESGQIMKRAELEAAYIIHDDDCPDPG